MTSTVTREQLSGMTSTERAQTVLSCGHTPTPTSGCGTGYAIDTEDRTLCYGCADDRERARMADPATRVMHAYVSSDGLSVTTWSGGVLARYMPGTASVSRSGWHGSRIWSHRFRAADGSQWYGRNAGNGMYITLRRAARNV